MLGHDETAFNHCRSCHLKVLLIKLTSLGDVIHTLAAARELVAARPEVQLHWAVDQQFASVLQACPFVHHVHALPMRRLGLKLWHPQWRASLRSLRAQAFDAVIDAQGLSKSALISTLSRCTAQGQRWALARQTDGSSYEAPTRWVADEAVQTPVHIHAVERSRILCAKALSYALPEWSSTRLKPWLQVTAHDQVPANTVALIHGTSRADKTWPQAHWVALGQRLGQRGFQIALMHGNDEEAQAAARIESQLQASQVQTTIWPRHDLMTLASRLAACCGVIGVDGGVSHIAVALGLPHVQIYNHDTAWRTGPLHEAHQLSVFQSPHPDLEAVWQAWLKVEQG
jgi:heptosyltransferase-1